ncbi:putative beta-glucosidase C [Cyphellophora attinorum]|uniref:beta-glucosidase n=1 Tax=Cyphellophora attinorum TaxID=1664694 RepID=A0A0N0NNW6_9EURO|nr:putative beta-glucosidase C [Phialophora attinorum]KPI42028.1 putative beta-glucosidase C [Phialophora attinorum]
MKRMSIVAAALLTLAQASKSYRDASLSVSERVEDLLAQMTVEEKAGQLFHSMLPQAPLNVTSETRNSTEFMLKEQLLTHFNLLGGISNPAETANFINSVQKVALSTRLGIPVTISTDPRHAFTENIGTGFAATSFSQWPESLGLAALRDASLVEKFADIARQEARWSRIANTMGEDAALTSELVVAYLKGFHGENFGPDSVSTVTKHFPGAGPMENGEDSHFVYGKNQTYPGNNFDHHLIPFKAAIAAGARQMMPYYSRPIGTKYEEVGFSFNKGIVTDLLQHELGFKGVVCSDWGLITDTEIAGQDMPARAWGVEYLSEKERALRILQSGVDQFGGETRPELIVDLVKDGAVSEERLDVSVRKLLREKFELGLFDSPFVDVTKANGTVGKPEFVQAGNDAQRRAYTLLTNTILPLKVEGKWYLEGINATYLESRGLTVVKTPEEAEFAILRLQTPYVPRPGGFEKNYHTGTLEFSEEEKGRQAKIYATVPTIVDIRLERPAAIPEIAEHAAALLANFGSGPEALLDVIFNVNGYGPEGKLPFDLPRSNAAVEASREDVPFDTKDPVFRFGHGLRYE